MELPSTTLRAATPADAKAVARIHVESWRTTYPGMIPDRYLAGMRVDDYAERWRRTLVDPAHRSLVFIAEEAGLPVGFASGGRDRDAERREVGELYAIYLLRSAQGRGHGRRLLLAVAEALAERGLTTMVVWVLRDNARARAFYERMGGVYQRERLLDFAAGFSVMEVSYRWADVPGELLAPR